MHFVAYSHMGTGVFHFFFLPPWCVLCSCGSCTVCTIFSSVYFSSFLWCLSVCTVQLYHLFNVSVCVCPFVKLFQDFYRQYTVNYWVPSTIPCATQLNLAEKMQLIKYASTRDTYTLHHTIRIQNP